MRQAPFDHPELCDPVGPTTGRPESRQPRGRHRLPPARDRRVGLQSHSGLCVPNAGDLFASGMQARIGGPLAPPPKALLKKAWQDVDPRLDEATRGLACRDHHPGSPLTEVATRWHRSAARADRRAGSTVEPNTFFLLPPEPCSRVRPTPGRHHGRPISPPCVPPDSSSAGPGHPVDRLADRGVHGEQALEVVGAQDQELAIAERRDVGPATAIVEQRQLAHEVAAAEPDPVLADRRPPPRPRR